MTTGCATLTFTLASTPAPTPIAANPAAVRRWTESRLTALTARVFAIAATSILIDALLYGIASRSASAGLARYVAAWSASASASAWPIGRSLVLAVTVFGVLAATAGATLGRVAAADLSGYPALLVATTTSCASAAAALRRLQSWA